MEQRSEEFAASSMLHQSALFALESRVSALSSELAAKAAETPEAAFERNAREHGNEVLQEYFLAERRKSLSALRSSTDAWLSLLSAPEASADASARADLEAYQTSVRGDVLRFEEKKRDVIESDWASGLAMPLALLGEIIAHCHWGAKYDSSGLARRKSLRLALRRCS